MTSYILTKSAKNDLYGIWYHTQQTWGTKQADRYLDTIEEVCENITQKKILWKSFDDTYPHLKSLRCEHHYIFFFLYRRE